jgi:hypothetical protein
MRRRLRVAARFSSPRDDTFGSSLGQNPPRSPALVCLLPPQAESTQGQQQRVWASGPAGGAAGRTGAGHGPREDELALKFPYISLCRYNQGVTTQVVLDSSRKAQGFGEVRWVAG